MADRVHPSAMPAPHPPQSAASRVARVPPTGTTTKGQLYSRPTYRPHPPAKCRRSRRGCCCACGCWLVLIVLALILVAAVAGGIFYALYHPQRPTFSVSSVRLSTLNIFSSDKLTSQLDIAVTAQNPNRNIVYLYDQISISVSSNGVGIGAGSLPAFVQDTKNTTVIRATAARSGQSIDSSVATDLKKSKIPLVIDLETKAGIKVGKLETKKIGIKVYCKGIEINTPKGKNSPPSPPFTPDIDCKIKLQIKIWKLTF